MQTLIKLAVLASMGLSLGLAFAHWNSRQDELARLAASDLHSTPFAARSNDPHQQFIPRQGTARPLPEKVQKLPILRWDSMLAIDAATQRPKQTLQDQLRSPVRIPGFIVPLELEDRETTEFLLVPTAGACYHVPPPPPEQMILVTMRDGEAPRREHGPVWVYGLMDFVTNTTEWGPVGYSMQAQGSFPYSGGYDP